MLGELPRDAQEGADLPADLGHQGRGAHGGFEYIEAWYNPHRRHSKLGYLSHGDYEQAHREQAAQPVLAGV